MGVPWSCIRIHTDGSSRRLDRAALLAMNPLHPDEPDARPLARLRRNRATVLPKRRWMLRVVSGKKLRRWCADAALAPGMMSSHAERVTSYDPRFA